MGEAVVNPADGPLGIRERSVNTVQGVPFCCQLIPHLGQKTIGTVYLVAMCWARCFLMHFDKLGMVKLFAQSAKRLN